MHETLCFSIQSLSPNLDDLPLRCDGCETVSGVVGSFSDCPRIGLPLWFATVRSFPHGKFGGGLARNAFLRDSRCTKPYVFPYKVCPRTSMIYLCGAIARSSIVLCSSVSADRIVMAASRLLPALAAFVILLSFAAGSRKSYWSGCMKAATVICQQIFSILALVIFLLKILFKSASKSCFCRSGVEIRFWSCNFRPSYA